MDYEPNPKHGSKAEALPRVSPAPSQQMVNRRLDHSVQVKPTSPRRVGVDKVNGEIVVLDQHLPGKFHGHVRAWDDLTPAMQDALKNAGLVDKKGNLS